MRDINTRIGVEDRASRKLQQAGRHVKTYGRTWRTAARVASRAMIGMDRGFRMLHRGMGKLMRRAKFMMIGFQITAIIMGVQMVSAALKYERALRNVTSLMAGAGMQALEVEKNFRIMDQAIRGIATRTGQMPLDLAEGMYNVVSATFDGASGLKVLEASALGAFAGLSTTEVVTGLLTKTLQAYRKEGESNNEVAGKSMDIMDMFFMSVNRGMFTFDDLAAKFGSVTSTGAAFGIELQDLLGFLSTATVRGVGMDEALTGMRQTILSIVSDSPAVAAAAEELFGADVSEMWGAQALAGKGLLGVLKGLNETLPEVPANVIDAAIAMEEDGGDAAGFMAEQLGLSVQAITALFPNIRALKGVLAVTGAGMSLYGENVESITESSGAMSRAQGEMVKSAQGALQFLKAAWATFKIDAGGIVLPFLKQATDGIMNWWGGLPAEFARSKGMTMSDMERGFGLEDGQEMFQRRVENAWADASPSERVGFILKDAWKTGMLNLGRWFDAGGEGLLERLGASLSNFFTSIMDAVAGTTTEGAKDSLGYKFGAAFITGFKNAWTDWVDGGGAQAFIQSTFGKIATIVGAGLVGGPGAALGAFGAIEGGQDPKMVLAAAAFGGIVWKVLAAKIATWAAGSAAASAAGAAASGGAGAAAVRGGAHIAAGVGGAVALGVGVTAVALVAGSVLLIEAALNRAMDRQVKQQAVDRQAAFESHVTDLAKIMSPEDAAIQASTNKPTLTTAAGRAVYSFGGASSGGGLGGAGIDWAAWAKSAFGEADDAGVVQKSAGELQYRAAQTFQRAADGIRIYGPGAARTPSTVVPSRGHQQAHGSSGTVTRATSFVAGEAGPEHYQFIPKYQGKAGGGGGVTIQGPLIGNATISTDMDVREVTAQIVREFEKAVSNG